MTQYKADFLKIALAIVIALAIFWVSNIYFTTQQASLLGLIAFLVTLWTNEALPLGAVSLLPIVLFPAFSILSTKETSINYAHPIIYLFLGGFLLAIAVEKTHLHTWIANKIFAIFPATPKGIIFSLTFIAGLLSSILSNTTTTLLLMSIALFLTENAKLKMRFALAIAYGATVGGILTPIGTPPNLILLGIMQDKGMELIPFIEWMGMVIPLVFMMFFVVASLLSLGLKGEQIDLERTNKPLDTEQKKVFYLLMGLVLLLLVNAPFKPYWNGLGLSETGILLGAGLLMFAPPFKILDWMQHRAKIPYRIMFLFGAGFSIAKAFSVTGLADEFASSLIAIADFPPILIILCVAILITFTTEITSNMALISIMLPVIYAVTVQTGLDSKLFMMVATVCSSYAFMLPIATAPNAIAMSSGVISIKTMARYGIVLNLIGIALVVLIAEFYWKAIL